jgi:hypothetical protein
MAPFNDGDWMGLLVNHGEKVKTDPLQGPFTNVVKISEALKALEIMTTEALENVNRKMLNDIENKHTEIFIAISRLDENRTDYKVLVQAGDKLRNILELCKGLAK